MAASALKNSSLKRFARQPYVQPAQVGIPGSRDWSGAAAFDVPVEPHVACVEFLLSADGSIRQSTRNAEARTQRDEAASGECDLYMRVIGERVRLVRSVSLGR